MMAPNDRVCTYLTRNAELTIWQAMEPKDAMLYLLQTHSIVTV